MCKFASTTMRTSFTCTRTRRQSRDGKAAAISARLCMLVHPHSAVDGLRLQPLLCCTSSIQPAPSQPCPVHPTNQPTHRPTHLRRHYGVALLRSACRAGLCCLPPRNGRRQRLAASSACRLPSLAVFGGRSQRLFLLLPPLFLLKLAAVAGGGAAAGGGRVERAGCHRQDSRRMVQGHIHVPPPAGQPGRLTDDLRHGTGVGISKRSTPGPIPPTSRTGRRKICAHRMICLMELVCGDQQSQHCHTIHKQNPGRE